MVRVSTILALSCIVLAKQANAAADDCINDYPTSRVASATKDNDATTDDECKVEDPVGSNALDATKACKYTCKAGYGDDNVSKKFVGAATTNPCSYTNGDGSATNIISNSAICGQEMCTFKGAYIVTYKETLVPSDYPTGDCDWGGAGCPKTNIDAVVDTVSCRDSTNFTTKDGDMTASFTCGSAGGSFEYGGGTGGCTEHSCEKLADQAAWDSLSGLPTGSKCSASTKTTALGITDSSVQKVGQMKQYSGDDGLYEACVVECKAPPTTGTQVFTWKSGGLPMCVLPEGVPHGTSDCKHGSAKGCTITDLQKTAKNVDCDTDTFNNNNDKTDWSNASCTAGSNGEPGVFTTTSPKMAFQICYSTKHPVTASPVTAAPITSAPITSAPATSAPTGFSAASTVAASFVAAASTALLMML